jgi:hypothetical protein
VAVLAWTAWVIVLVEIAPARLLTYLAFFMPLTVALTATATVAAYAVEWRAGRPHSLIVCGRRGTLVAAVVILNLAILAAHRWSLAVGGITVAAAVLAELAFIQRDRMRRS